MDLREITNDLIAFAKLERLIAVICMLIPVFLVLADQGQVRESISNYVYMGNSHIFGLLLGVAAMLFIVNGVIYIKTQNLRDCKKQGKWYNNVLGVCLLGVVLFPHEDQPFLHYFFAILFFAGSALVIALFNDKEHRKTSWTIAALSLGGLVLWLFNSYIFVIPLTQWLTLFWAEWLSLTVIAMHYILESLGELS